MKVTVSQDHISNGIRGSRCDCPIALAIKEQHHRRYVGVGAFLAKLDRVTYYMPIKAQKFVLDFDLGREVSPIEFDITEVHTYES